MLILLVVVDRVVTIIYLYRIRAVDDMGSLIFLLHNYIADVQSATVRVR